jgi:hypothetical protein
MVLHGPTFDVEATAGSSGMEKRRAQARVEL